MPGKHTPKPLGLWAKKTTSLVRKQKQGMRKLQQVLRTGEKPVIFPGSKKKK